MSPPQYSTIPLCTASTASTVYCVHCVTASTESTGLTILHQSQCSHHNISLFHCIHCILCPLVWPFYTKDNVPTTIYHYCTVYCIHCVLHPLCPLCDCVHCIHWFDLFAPKTMSPPPYTTIPLHTVSSGLTFLHQRQCPHHHIPLFHCILHLLCTASTGLTFLHQRQCPYHHILLFHCVLHPLCDCIHCIHWFNLFVPKTMSPPPYTILHSVCTVSTVSTVSSGSTFLHQRQCPHHHILLFHCILHPLHIAPTAYCIHCIHCMPYMAYVGNLFALTKYPPHPPMLLVIHETIMNQKLVISNQYLISPLSTKKVPKTYTFLLCGQFKLHR